VSCLPSSPPFPPQTTPTPSPASSSAKQCALPYEATRARPAILATLVLKQAEGPLLSVVPLATVLLRIPSASTLGSLLPCGGLHCLPGRQPWHPHTAPLAQPIYPV
jgi:hypothetical protein